MVNYKELVARLAEDDVPLGLLTMQSTSTTEIVMKTFPKRLKALFSAEHGFYGSAVAGQKTASSWHPYWNLPIHSLYGEFRKPTPEMLSGIGRMVIDLQDIGVRCYTYLATLKNTLEACAEHNIPVTVLDREVPMGNILDGPMRRPEYASFVAPLNVPFCHGMTPGESAIWITRAEGLEIDLDVVKLEDWSHRMHTPWPNFVPPSPSIKSWDSAVLYPMTVFTEAFPAVDCDRDGLMAFRVLGSPWMDARKLMDDLASGLFTCGVEMRPYRYSPQGGKYKGFNFNGIFFTVSRPGTYYPVTASILILVALSQRYPKQMLMGARPDWFDKLYGSSEVREMLETVRLKNCNLDFIFQNWMEGQDEYLRTKVDLYK